MSIFSIQALLTYRVRRLNNLSRAICGSRHTLVHFFSYSFQNQETRQSGILEIQAKMRYAMSWSWTTHHWNNKLFILPEISRVNEYVSAEESETVSNIATRKSHD